jgi:signal peptidase II
MRTRILLLLLALTGLVGCDHATKYWAESTLRAAPPVEVVDRVVTLRYTQNTDVAFNLLRRVPQRVRFPLIVGLVTVELAVVGWMLTRRRRPIEIAALALVLGGGIGNLADRVARGYVVDFIHVQHWPVFNMADVWVAAGAILLLLAMRRAPPEPTAAPSG